MLQGADLKLGQGSSGGKLNSLVIHLARLSLSLLREAQLARNKRTQLANCDFPIRHSLVLQSLNLENH